MRVEMNGGAIVAVAIFLIGMLAIGLIAYYIRKGRAERMQSNAEVEPAKKSDASTTNSADG